MQCSTSCAFFPTGSCEFIIGQDVSDNDVDVGNCDVVVVYDNYVDDDGVIVLVVSNYYCSNNRSAVMTDTRQSLLVTI